MRCQYCNEEATHHEPPFPGATWVQDLCEHHYLKVMDMNAEDEP